MPLDPGFAPLFPSGLPMPALLIFLGIVSPLFFMVGPDYTVSNRRSFSCNVKFMLPIKTLFVDLSVVFRGNISH